jgi:Tfp pilus assembly protein PilO
MNRILAAIICFVAAFGLGAALTYPSFISYFQKRGDLEQRKTELDYSQEYFSKLKKMERELEEYSEETGKIEKALPEYFSVPAFFANMQKLASQGGLILNSISGKAITSGGSLQTHSYGLSLSGTYSNFNNYLSILEKSAKLIEIKSFSFSSPEEEEETTNFNLTVETKSY